MIGVLCLNLIANITNLLTYPVTTTNSRNVTTTSCYMTDENENATDIIAFLMRIYVPYAIMATFNGLVISRLKQSRKRVGIITSRQTTGMATTKTQLTGKEIKFIKATLMMDFIFLAMHTPVASWLAMSLVDNFTNWLSVDDLTNAIGQFYSNIAQLIAFSYSTMTIFIFVAFNSNFRQELIDLLRLRRFFPQHAPHETSTRSLANIT